MKRNRQPVQEHIASWCSPPETREFVRWLRAAESWPNFTAFLDQLDKASDRETLLDHRACLRYALIFKGHGFSVLFEPTGLKGPDLKVERDGVSAVVEVSRYRRVKLGPESFSPKPEEGVPGTIRRPFARHK